MTATPVEGLATSAPRTRTFEVLVVTYVTTALVLVVFWSHLSGSSVPPLDFLGHYNTDTFAWWRDGGFFDPPQWMAYMWGGYPSVMDVQNSSFYLPVGIAAELFQFDLRTSAVVSALHVAVGSVGMYVLVRRLGMSMPVSFVGLIVWFFIGPFFSNAQHLDIMRSYAWLPWIMLILSPKWPWRRWWAILVAGLVLWQGMLSMYPGVLIAGFYVLPLWVIGMQVVYRPRLRHFLVPAAISMVAAVAMLTLRYLPFVLIRGGASSPRGYNSSEWSWGFLATALYPYDLPTLPNDIPFRSFFVGAVVLAALVATSWRNRLTLVALPMVAVPVLLGLPIWPWSSAVRLLPGLDISRFLMSDFKPYLLMAVVLVALAALHELWVAARLRADLPTQPDVAAPPWPWIRAAVILLVVTVALGWTGDYAVWVWVGQSLALAVALVLVMGLARTGSMRAATSVVLGLALVAAVSGLLAVRATTQTWEIDRAGAESVYGEPVDSLIARRVDAGQVLMQRPARVKPTEPVDIYALLAPAQNRVHYEGGFSVAGYITMAGSGAYDRITYGLLDPATAADALEFWAAPGIGLRSDDAGIPGPAEVQTCATTGRCGEGVTLTPVNYVASGSFAYEISTDTAVTMIFNEAYYPGWSATACAPGGSDCVEIPMATGSGGQIVAGIPAGDWVVAFRYAIPGQRTSWVLWWAAGSALVLSAVAQLLRSRNPRARSRSTNESPSATAGVRTPVAPVPSPAASANTDSPSITAVAP